MKSARATHDTTLLWLGVDLIFR